jgi:hypothetical protein
MVVACDEISIVSFASWPAGAGVAPIISVLIIAAMANATIVCMTLRSPIVAASSTAQWYPERRPLMLRR